MNVQVKGTKQEEVWITISTKELLNTIKGFIKKDGSEWIKSISPQEEPRCFFSKGQPGRFELTLEDHS